ncbi:MAG: pyridoxal phosphate-dependent aminotransferase [Actinobacteria bacterium]|nr:pyridoxal phosphate-dependent aminotransferase [Actinomycetota bacterium]
MHLSGILRTANQVREIQAAGTDVLDLSIGDFSPKYFRIPERLLRGVEKALESGATNYPPPSGLLALRKAVSGYVERCYGVRYPIESILITSGGRPALYGAYKTVISPGDTVVYSVPSWQNDSYAWLSGANAVEIEAVSENGFQPTLAEIAPYIGSARLICLCSPGNPTGTAMGPETLKSILDAVVEENRRREKDGNERPLFLLYDQIYSSIRVKDNKHRYALALVPESAPYVMTMDGASKAFAATGLRVGWLLAPPAIARKAGELLSYVGAWAPHAEQAGLTELLNDPDAIGEYRATMDAAVHERLDVLHRGFAAMRDEGLPVDVLCPDGAIYVSLQLKLKGKRIGGRVIEDNEAIRSLVLEKTGVAVVPFQAFGLMRETGWFRLSVGAVSMDEIAEVFPRIRALLEQIG